MNDSEEKFDDGVKKCLEANAKDLESNAKYASEDSTRSNLYGTNLVEASVKNATELTQSKALQEAYEKQAKFAEDLKAGFESSHQENMKAFEAAKEEYAAITASFYPAADSKASK